MSDSISPNTTDDLTPLESPLDFMPEAFGSPGDSLRLMRTDSSLLESRVQRASVRILGGVPVNSCNATYVRATKKRLVLVAEKTVSDVTQ